MRSAPLDYCQETGKQLDPDINYVYQPERGLRPATDFDPSHWPVLLGKYLIQLVNQDFEDPQTIPLSKSLMRFLLSLHLQDQVLTTRQILIDLKKL